MKDAKERIYFYRGWKIEYTGRFWVDVDDKSYVFTTIDEAYDEGTDAFNAAACGIWLFEDLIGIGESKEDETLA